MARRRQKRAMEEYEEQYTGYGESYHEEDVPSESYHQDYAEESDDAYFRRKFPNMVPNNKAPTMFTLNGIGTTVYGERDFDQETQTYIKTFCFTFFFIPIFAIRAYRVMEASPGDGWYFLGTEPLSGLAKGWNIFMLCSILTLLGVGTYVDYKAVSPGKNSRYQYQKSRYNRTSPTYNPSKYRQKAGYPGDQQSQQGYRRNDPYNQRGYRNDMQRGRQYNQQGNQRFGPGPSPSRNNQQKQQKQRQNQNQYQ